MTPHTSEPGRTSVTFLHRREPLALALGVLLVLVLMTHWGGSASPGPLLVTGIAVLLAAITAYGVLVRWLFFSPLSAATSTAAHRPSADVRQLLAILLVISGAFFVTGGFWDESWHRMFGVPLGEDFFWRPHILIYICLGTINLFALGGLYLVLRQGRGDLRRRFRAQPLLGLLALASGFQVLVTPLDPLWHEVYGLDITAWSLPHILVAVGFMAVMLAAVSVQLSLVPSRGWRTIRGLRLQELLAGVLMALAMTVLIQFSTAEWDNMLTFDPSDPFFQRPVWLLPVIIAAIAALMGSTATHATRRAGMATVVGLLTLGLRLLLISVFNAGEVGMTAAIHGLLIAPLVALDASYAVLLRGRTMGARLIVGGGVAAALAVLVVDLPLIGQWLAYPPVSAETVPWMILMTLLATPGFAWLGARIGQFLESFDRQAETAPAHGSYTWVSLAVFLAALAFVAFFISTAAPPVL
jgi:hypothetical protein